MDVPFLPTLNACLNLASFVCLVCGLRAIRRGAVRTHIRWMAGALSAGALFFVFYAIYHFRVGSTPYPHHDWTRPVYFAVLISHTVLAAIDLPLVIVAVRHALKARFERHKKWARIAAPIWLYVSPSGIVVYLMLYWL